MRHFPPLLSFVILLIVFSGCKNINPARTNAKPNLLFISIDDLRPELGCYGKEYIHSPNIDRLADQSTLFTNHYVQVPTCGASRYAMLTGMLPTSQDHLGNNSIEIFISNNIDGSTQPETFIHALKNNGYYTVGLGKISHSADGYIYGYNDSISNQKELPNSWSDMDFDYGKWGTGWNTFFGFANGENRQSMDRQVKPYEAGNVDDDGYPDGLTADLAIGKLKEVASKSGPFVLAVGFFKPHLPFTSPKKYWNLYDSLSIDLAPYVDIPINSHPSSLQKNGEFNSYEAGDEKLTLENRASDEYARKLRHAYFASISYVDAQVGKVMDELDRLGLADNTIVVLWGDHGYNLGDYGVWGKHTLFERSLKSAFMIKAPGVTASRSTKKVVSTVDLYPTIMELCGVELPYEMDGKSLVHLMNDGEEDWEEKALGYWRNGWTIRTERYRLVRYYREEGPEYELYDHLTDSFETKNIAADHPEIVAELLTLSREVSTEMYED